ncbi:triose-phosphate isomerase [Alkalibaculum sp. M08DMB]|uniref:Triosephosphate isomerase n=1 Tax=Alkalibaculum sporogenes TaxID=2655001 RepID=A0A6A7K962_9FIRM|nr:triose-phosphate isomerase [Alkalibaculum sporogenes]MPW25932.1 triose-phosphate isomerase [Alkalibaculum sporogenes]
MRKSVIAGNWKLNNDVKATKEFLFELRDKIKDTEVEVVVCPPFTSLSTAVELVKGTDIKVGAQNMHWETSGAYTGEVSGEMLAELGVEYVIIGHSERRQYFNETDETVNKKLIKSLKLGLIPIICVGESLEQREKGIQKDIVTKQVISAFKNVNTEDAKKVIVAYEPIWAIGTGITATSAQAEEVCGWIRETFVELYSTDVAQVIRIQYGGSVNNGNVKELMNMPNIDGALVGGASLKLDFENLVKY